MNSKIKYDKLTYYSKNKERMPISFNGFNCSLGLKRKIKHDCIDLEKAKENRKTVRSNLSETTRGKREHKSEELKNTINNLKMFYKAR